MMKSRRRITYRLGGTVRTRTRQPVDSKRLNGTHIPQFGAKIPVNLALDKVADGTCLETIYPSESYSKPTSADHEH